MYDANTNWSNESAYLNNLISNGSAGQSAWARNQLGTLNAAKSALSPVNLNDSIGSFNNALDVITSQSEKASARSLEYAKQHQDWSAQQAAAANSFNAAEAAKNRDWQEYMSNSAHQREVADLKAAGLNPVLAAMNGNGASVGSGATASANMPSGSSGHSDTSVNSALVSILGSMLTAQTAIQNQLVSARTQEAVADRYTAMSHLTAEIAAAASMYGADNQYRIKADFPDNLSQLLNSVLSGTGYSWSDIGGDIKHVVDSYVDDHPSIYKDIKDGVSGAAGKVRGFINNILGKNTKIGAKPKPKYGRSF